jgi:hypothetical protein
MDRQTEGWLPFTEPIVLPPEGGDVYWIEDGDGYLIIPKPDDFPWPKQQCFHAAWRPAPPRSFDIEWIEIT